MKKIAILGIVSLLVIMIFWGMVGVVGDAETQSVQEYFTLETANCQWASLRQSETETNYAKDVYIWNTTGTGDYHQLFRFGTNQIHPNSTITTAKLRLKFFHTGDPANVSLHSMLDYWVEHQCTWNNSQTSLGSMNNGTWARQGGDYNYTYNVTQYIETTDTWYEYDITTLYRDWVNNGTSNLGVMFVSHDADNGNIIRFYETTDASKEPQVNITYTPPISQPTAPTTSITEDTWTWLGYLNATDKTGATLYSEITNCSYVVMQNATTGYYYTYGPGIAEAFNVTYGSAICILTTTDETWGHV